MALPSSLSDLISASAFPQHTSSAVDTHSPHSASGCAFELQMSLHLLFSLPGNQFPHLLMWPLLLQNCSDITTSERNSLSTLSRHPPKTPHLLLHTKLTILYPPLTLIYPSSWHILHYEFILKIYLSLPPFECKFHREQESWFILHSVSLPCMGLFRAGLKKKLLVNKQDPTSAMAASDPPFSLPSPQALEKTYYQPTTSLSLVSFLLDKGGNCERSRLLRSWRGRFYTKAFTSKISWVLRTMLWRSAL